MIEDELDPWLVVINHDHLALWQLGEPAAAAIALFSERQKAEDYARTLPEQPTHAIKPSRRELLGLMIKCYQEQIIYAVLDPNETTARKIFPLREVLKAAKAHSQNH